jgi:hypothetical protein
MATKGDDEPAAMRPFLNGLDHDIETKEERLKAHLERLKLEIERALADLTAGNCVNRASVALHRMIDRESVALNDLYAVRSSLNAKGGAK